MLKKTLFSNLACCPIYPNILVKSSPFWLLIKKIDPKKKKKKTHGSKPNNFCTTNTMLAHGIMALSLSLSCCPAPLGIASSKTLQKLKVGKWSMKILTRCNNALLSHFTYSLTHSLTHSFQLHSNNNNTT
jgi:hypothetical protein